MSDERTVDSLLDRLQATLNELSEAAEEHAESEYQRGAEAGYQDGLNDALGFVKDYLQLCRRENDANVSNGREGPYDETYLEGLDDALITLRENGAEDVEDVTDSTGAVVAQRVVTGSTTPTPEAAPVAEPAAHLDENVDSP